MYRTHGTLTDFLILSWKSILDKLFTGVKFKIIGANTTWMVNELHTHVRYFKINFCAKRRFVLYMLPIYD